MSRRLCLVALVALALTSPAAAEKPRDLPLALQAIEVTARPITSFLSSAPSQTRFGSLEWIGGLDLTSNHRGFGGLSGIVFPEGDGRQFLAISDAGIWLEGEIVTQGEKPVAIRNVRMTPMQNERGQSVAGLPQGDAESIAIISSDVLIGFEGINEIRRYPRAAPLTSPGEPFAVPPGVKRLRRSRGLESLAIFPPGTRHAGAVLAVGESPIRGEDFLSAWIIGGSAPGRFQIVYRDDFHATDAAFLPNGDLLLLERRVAPPFGLWTRIRRLPGPSMTPGAVVDGRVIFEADLAHAVDNLEGLALHRGRDGGTYLTLVSDDNYSVLQRTLLLRFRLVD